MRLLIVFFGGELRFLCRSISEREDGRMQEQVEWRKKKETSQGEQKEEEGDCFTYSHPFAKFGAALLIRIDAIHRAKYVVWRCK